jgi:hypothetical protein
MTSGLRHCILLLAAVKLLFTGTSINGQAPLPVTGPPRDTFALFADESLLEVKISFDITTFLRKNLKEESLDGTFNILLGESDSLVKDIKIKTRGIFRLQYCAFPPIQINFKSFLPAYHFLGSIKKIKLVTHCEPGEASNDYVLKEYLAYKMFNILTDTSYRVRLLKINYIDTQKKRKPINQFGFFIEPTGILALRTNTIVLKKTSLTQRHIIPSVMNRMAIFNYMIGNYDWAVPNQHNLIILKSLDVRASQMGIAVPYDFDYTGFVNPYYAKPVEETGITNIRERLFTGICRTREEFRSELLKIASHKDQFYSLIDDFPYMTQRTKKDLISYLDEFFVSFETGNGLESLIDKLVYNCKKL